MDIVTTGIHPTGMRGFLIVWVGQVVSMFGSALSRFLKKCQIYAVYGAKRLKISCGEAPRSDTLGIGFLIENHGL